MIDKNIPKHLWRCNIKGFVIAGAGSGSGKTTLTLGVLTALKKQGVSVAAFKVGPDFIDPGHHSRITGSASRNLDGWMLPEKYNLDCFNRHAAHADMVVVEGVMGLFDGFDGKSEAGSTAQMAKWLNLPVILVVDAASMARSAAALVQGFEQFDPDLAFAGVIFNNVGSEHHLAFLEEALEGHVKMPLLGGLRRHRELTIPERHLGLVTPSDHPLSPGFMDDLADWVEKGIDLDKLMDRLPPIKRAVNSPETDQNIVGEPVRIGVAMDNAFCFYYQDNLDLMAAAGADLVFFSPMTDPHLPEDLHGLYFGGGYPELYIDRLSTNKTLHHDIRQAVAQGMPVYAECGGFMYLGQTLTDIDGRTHSMVGCFPQQFTMDSRLSSLGYREITFTRDTPLGPAGETLRGHEYHYSEMTGKENGTANVYRVTTRTGLERDVPGFQTANCLGSYVHLHFGSNPEAACHFVSYGRGFKNR